MGCCGCFGFTFGSKSKNMGRPYSQTRNNTSQELLLDDEDDWSCNGDVIDTGNRYDFELQSPTRRSEEIIMLRILQGLICRKFPVKETCKLVRSKDDDGNKMVNEYFWEGKIGSGSYGKVVLYRSSIDGKHYAIKGEDCIHQIYSDPALRELLALSHPYAFHKSHLLRLRVAPCETAMSDVLREVSIMKMLNHPNIVNLVEVIDDPTTDQFYMVLEYVESKLGCDGSGPFSGLSENKARSYLRDIVSGLMYLHVHNVVHGDIKPDNLLVTANGTVKIGDFGVSQVFEDDNDELRRSPGTPAFTAPECCLGSTYRGKGADTWAVGVTLYFMVLGMYPFLGETLQDTYDKIVNSSLSFPDHINPLLKNLLEGLLCKDPTKRLTLEAVAGHKWVVGEEGPISLYLCWCKRKHSGEESDESYTKVEI